MRAMMILLVLACAPAWAMPAGPAPTASTHVRAITPVGATLLREATSRSMIVQALVRALQKTDVVVYLADSAAGSDDAPRAYLRFVADTPGARYLLVCIDPRDAPPPEGVVLLAHELQHALEVAATPSVRDAASLARLYSRIGWKTQAHRYESQTARDISSRVWREQTGQSR
jgi:hypothetical protein